MKTNISKLHKSSGWMSAISRVLIFTLLATLMMPLGWYSPQPAQAAITQQQAWTAGYNNTALPTSFNVTVNAGTNRMLVVAVSHGSTAATTPSCSVTYGGTGLTLAAGTSPAPSGLSHSWIFYLPENATLMNGTARALVATITNGGTIVRTSVNWAVYAGVDQSASPIRSTAVYNSGGATITSPSYGTALTVGSGDQAVEINSLVRTGSTTPRTISAWASPWAVATGGTAYPAGGAGGTNSMNTYMGTTTTAGDTTAGHTTSGTAYVSKSAISIKQYSDLWITDGTNPANAAVAQGTTNNALDGFTFQKPSGTGTVTSLRVTGNANFTSTNIPTNGVKVWRDSGTTVGVLDGSDVQISTASTAVSANTSTVTISSEAVNTTLQNYLVTIDTTAGATLGAKITGTITSASGTGIAIVDYGDTASATLTVTARDLVVGDGTNPVNRNAPRSSTNNALDGLTLGLTSGTGTVTSLRVLGSANFTLTNIPTNGVKVWRDSGTTVGWLDGGDVMISTASTAVSANSSTVTISSEPLTSTAQNYLVTVDITAGATNGQSFTGRVISAVGTNLGTPTYGDSSSATLTVNNLAAGFTSCSDCHGYPPYDNTIRDPVSGGFVGDHQPHSFAACNTCHAVPATTTSADFEHRNGNIQMQAVISGGSYTRGTSFAQTNTLSTTGCSNIACHGGNNPTPQWGVGTASCAECHNAVLSAPQASAVSGGTVTNRRNVSNEFSLTWSHKRSAGGAVTNYDCIVCHMEGDMSTGKSTSSKHMNGYIDLRDPDTGSQIMQVQLNEASGTWNQTGVHSGPGTYVSTATTASFVRFSRNLTVRLEADPNWQSITAIQINQCLKCHDADGASNPSAQVPSGSALQPFGVAITGHVAPYSGNGNGNVVDVYSSFSTSNAAYHPILGRQNNSFAQGTMMVSPWNITKTTGNITSFGWVMSCWDCHAPTGATGTQNSTVTAHGGAVTVKAGIYQSTANTAATNLCINCHNTNYSTTSGNHATGSAFLGGSGNMNTTTMPRCAYCHAWTAAQGGTAQINLTNRPLRGENFHGFNDRNPNTPGSKWVNGANSHRPYGFIRNTLSYWSPTSVSTAGETLQRSRGCTGTGGTCGTDMGGTTTYGTPGGAY